MAEKVTAEMARTTLSEMVVKCTKLPDERMDGLCQEDAAVVGGVICRTTDSAKCQLGMKAPNDEKGADAWQRLMLVLAGRPKEAYALPDMPPEQPVAKPAAQPAPASKAAAPAAKPVAPAAQPAAPSRPKTPTTK